MTIDTLELNKHERKRVAYFATAPAPELKRAFEDREYQVTECSDAELNDPAYLAGLAAVVFTQLDQKPLRITHHLENHATRLLDHDCRIIVRSATGGLSSLTGCISRLRLPTAGLPAPEAAELAEWQPTGRGDPPLPHVRVFDASISWPTIVNFITGHPPGMPPNFALKIELMDATVQLPFDYQLLIRRAFADCSKVCLESIDAGHSGVGVYRAYAELEAGTLGQWPLPYFVKIGRRSKVFTEYQNYRNRVSPYIPFHLGPHLIPERCCLGAKNGIIVGDYVEESESLLDCARGGRAAPAIACLFGRTLHGWYRSASKERGRSYELTKMLLPHFPENIGPERIARARELGASQGLEELRMLLERCASSPVLIGPIHGDLHADNVRVRTIDAIVIDFYANDRGPLVYDLACLEASLLVDGFSGDQRAIQPWFESLAPLYDHITLERAPVHVGPKDRSSWFYACVAQIRLHARQLELDQHQYAIALAVALLVKASKDSKAAEPEASRRAAAYALAERLLSAICDLQEVVGAKC